ncbi:mediator complex subunit Med5-domain-containing protein [Gongronella butleri]|nr:mediator complex subunit Med5-domain-containing protein [Gongronella butleri]
MSAYSLETVLRYAYFHGYTSAQWAQPTKECLESADQDLTQDLCDLLLKHLFSNAGVHHSFLESYVTYAVTGDAQVPVGMALGDRSLVGNKQFLSTLVLLDDHYVTSAEHAAQWAYLLRLLPGLVADMDGDRTDIPLWAPIVSRLLVMLAHVVAVGLYPHRAAARRMKWSTKQKRRDTDDMDIDDDDEDDLMAEDGDDDVLQPSQSQLPHFSLTNNTTQLALDSQMTNASQSLAFDPEATFDLDIAAEATQPDGGQDEFKSEIIHSSTNVAVSAAVPPQNAGNAATIGSTASTAAAAAAMAPVAASEMLELDAPGKEMSQASSSLYGSLPVGTGVSHDEAMDRTSLTWSNAVAATVLMIDLIEKKGAKRIIDKYNQQKSESDDDEPWVTCHDILAPSPDDTPSQPQGANSTASSGVSSSSHNMYIQKLHLLIERLSDRDLERRLAVHMKYHELEDEGTARAMPSAGLMSMNYHIVQIRPALPDDSLVERLIRLQAIKGSFDESFYLELWLSALTGLREASLSTSCQQSSDSAANQQAQQQKDTDAASCDTAVATNRLLWKSLVLVKLPTLISKLQERKQKEDLAHFTSKRDATKRDATKPSNQDRLNALESSLMELRTFTGLLNACSPPACCAEFYVPSSKSSDLVDRFAFGQAKVDEEDDEMMMMMINEDNYTNQDSNSPNLNSPAFIKTIRSISDDDIFTSIVHACLAHGLIRETKVEILMANHHVHQHNQLQKSKDAIKDEENASKPIDDYTSLLDTDILDADDGDQQSHSSEKSNALSQVDQNIEYRIAALQEDVSKGSISELIHIAFVSLIHWRKVADFLLEFLQEKAQVADIRALSHICSALTECPAAIDLILELYSPRTILGPLETICNEWSPTEDYVDMGDSENQGDEDDDVDGMQQWYCKFGNIWTFVLVVAGKFEITRIINSIFKNKAGFCYQFFVNGPVIYNNTTCVDSQVETVVTNWLTAMGGDGISDDLLRSTKLQDLLKAVPTMVYRLIMIYDAGNLELETFTGILSYFKRRFLQFTLVPCVTKVLCDELFTHTATAITCLTRLFTNPQLPDVRIALSANMVLGSLRAWKEQQRQFIHLQKQRQQGNNGAADTLLQHVQQLQDQVGELEQLLVKVLALDDDERLSFPETITSGVTRRNLVEKSNKMFRYIVKSGRSMYMNDVDGDAKTLWHNDNKKQVMAHYLDMVMFQAALKMGGTHWFVGMIVDAVLEAGKSGGAVRAAELGSALVTMPLMYNAQGGSACFSLLRSLLQDVVPASINRHAIADNMSFFQGQTLGVFVGNCLAVMYKQPGDRVDELATQFFDALVIDRVRGGDMSQLQLVPASGVDGSRFAAWDDKVVTTPLWRGFVKGVMSNPYIKDFWPHAYTS